MDTAGQREGPPVRPAPGRGEVQGGPGLGAKGVH